MKLIDFTNAAKGLQMSFRILEHLQQALTESIDGVMKAFLGTNNNVVILNGAAISVVGSDYTITAGIAYYNGEIFYIDAASFTAGGGQVGVFVIDTTYIAQDPIQYADLNSYNTHSIRKLKFQAGASGSGVADHDEVVTFRSQTEFAQLDSKLNTSKFNVADTENINIKVLNLQNANLNTGVSTFNFTHGINIGNLIMADCWITGNDGTVHQYSRGGYLQTTSLNIQFIREAAGLFDAANFNDATIKIIIAYTV